MKHRVLPILLMALLAALPGEPAHAGPGPGGEEAGGEEAPAQAVTPEPDDDGDEDEAEPYTLSAAYPNPFRTRTRFDLRVKKTQRVAVEVYNLLGQRVRTLFEGRLRAGNERTFAFEAGSLPSGLYLCRVKGETFTAARRVTLVQ